MEHFKILIIGNDYLYYRKLEDLFREKIQNAILNIETIEVSSHHNLNQILSHVLDKKPHVAFVDLDVDNSKMSKLIQFLSKHEYYQENGLVGVASQISGKKHIPWTFLENGTHAFYCKSIEAEDVIYQTLSRYLYKKPVLQEYYLKNITSPQTFKMPIRVGLYHEGGLHVEGFLSWKEGAALKVQFQDRFMSGEYICKLEKKSNNNNYYAYPWNADLGVDFVHSIEPRYEKIVENSKEKNAKKNIYVQQTIQSEIDQLHSKMKALRVNWKNKVEELMKEAVPKHLRLMVIDPELSIYNLSDDDYDIYPFSIRIHRHIVEKHFVKERPDIICWMIPDGTHSGTVEQYFISMMELIEKQTSYAPVVVLFNSPFSHDFYSKLAPGYKVVVDNGPLDIGLILHYASLVMDEEEVFKKEKVKDGHFPDKNDPESFALAHVPVSLIGLTESYVLFTCEQELIDGCHLYWEAIGPLGMMVMAMPQFFNGQKYFVGFFQALNEVDKRDLRAKLNQNSKVA